MAYEIDHLFVRASPGAPEAELLVEFGLTEGSPNVHPGQGTANRRFFFHNAALELLWVSNPTEARSEITQRTSLWERWSGRKKDCSPFGVCLRPSVPGDSQPPFSAWEYRPAFLPSGLTIHVADDAPLTEPMWFFVAFTRRPDVAKPDRREPIEHPIGISELTGVRIVAPSRCRPSAAAECMIQTGLLSMTPGPEHLLELTFDGNREGRCHDFRTALPILFRW